MCWGVGLVNGTRDVCQSPVMEILTNEAGVMKEKMRSISKTEGKYTRRAPDEEDLPPRCSESRQA